MRVVFGLVLLALSSPLAGQTEQSTAPAGRPKMGVQVATPNGQRLLIGFTATAPLADLKEIEARMIELNCPPVRIQENGDDSKITAMFAETCNENAAVAYMGEIIKSKYPALRGLDVMILPVAEPAP